MGKTKAKKRGKHRLQPTGQKCGEEMEEWMENGGNFGGRTLPLLQQLSSPAAEEKECACTGLANLVFQPGAVPVLIRQDVVRRLGPLLVDNNRNIQEAAAGALRFVHSFVCPDLHIPLGKTVDGAGVEGIRLLSMMKMLMLAKLQRDAQKNLSLSGGADVCAKMVEQDVMTPLTTFIQQSLESLESINSSPESEYKKQTISLVVQAINLLWNVCESSGTAVEIFNMKGLLPHLVQCLKTDIYPMSLAMPAAQCLHTVTEDNTSAAQALCGSSHLMKTIEKALVTEPSTSEVMLLKVLSAGILYNVRYAIPMCSFSELVQAVVKVLSQVLEIDCLEMLGKMLPELEKAEEVQMLLSAQQLGLEILSNVCCADETGEDDWEDVADVRSETSDEGTDSEEDLHAIDDDMQNTNNLSAEMVKAIVNQQVPKKVLDKAVFGDVRVYEALNQHSEGKRTVKSLSVVQIRALICLNNITASMDVELLGGVSALGQLWNTLFSLTYGSECHKYLTDQDDFLEAATGVMRSVLEKLSSLNAPQFITEEQVSLLCQTAVSARCDAVKVKLLSILGYVGKMAAARDDTIPVLQSLGVVLRDIVTSQTSLWIICEALDAIFDTFADGPQVNSVLCSIGLLTTLQQLVPVLKTRVKSERRTLGDHYPVVDAARTNLTRFLKYKAKGH